MTCPFCMYILLLRIKKSFSIPLFRLTHLYLCVRWNKLLFRIFRTECGTWNGMDMMDLVWWVVEDEAKLPFPFDIYFMTFHSSTCTLFFRFLFFFWVYYIKHTYFMLNFLFCLLLYSLLLIFLSCKLLLLIILINYIFLCIISFRME